MGFLKVTGRGWVRGCNSGLWPGEIVPKWVTPPGLQTLCSLGFVLSPAGMRGKICRPRRTIPVFTSSSGPAFLPSREGSQDHNTAAPNMTFTSTYASPLWSTIFKLPYRLLLGALFRIYISVCIHITFSSDRRSKELQGSTLCHVDKRRGPRRPRHGVKDLNSLPPPPHQPHKDQDLLSPLKDLSCAAAKKQHCLISERLLSRRRRQCALLLPFQARQVEGWRGARGCNAQGPGSGPTRAAVAGWLYCSLPTKANWLQSPAGSLPDIRLWESCRTMPLVGRFFRGSPISPSLSFRRCSIIASLTLTVNTLVLDSFLLEISSIDFLPWMSRIVLSCDVLGKGALPSTRVGHPTPWVVKHNWPKVPLGNTHTDYTARFHPTPLALNPSLFNPCVLAYCCTGLLSGAVGVTHLEQPLSSDRHARCLVAYLLLSSGKPVDD
ncbi:hypothetical protein PR048_005796 [Dryococelus australis]|uniref:Uncharacterized protein n=1 Tax=Dryococelus australis TaxID=614101 RepID=A0ABQ9I979_9NEOP|nr:hypothetical protein PR048_005796 [Dryococelus australis]